MSGPETPLPPVPTEVPAAAAVPMFREYGQGGDYVGHRRSRRAFRYTVIAIVAFVAAMRYYEGFKKLDLYETQYRMSLTLLAPSARPILRNIVRLESQSKGQPTPLYIEALAGVEEDDKILPTYDSAAHLGPNNAGLLMKYGCELFLQRNFEAAREKFREAGVHPPRNALPNYLEAAALAEGLKPGSDLSEAMAIVARANNSGAPLIFPSPLWHPTLPREGEYYAEHRRDLARKVCAPLSQLKQLLVERAAHDIETGAIDDWDAWLSKLQDMGRRIATAHGETNDAESTQVMAGINIELEATALRAKIAEKTGQNAAAFTASVEKLKNAMALFSDFENERQIGINRSRDDVWRPLRMLEAAIGFTGLIYLLVLAYGYVFGAQPGAVAVAHTKLGVGMLGLGIVAFGATLHALILTGNHAEIATSIERASYALIAVLLAFGMAYPSLSLPRVGSVVAERGEADRAAARRARRSAGVALSRRYFGTLLGGIFIMMSVWTISFRMESGIYPDQVQLLVSGMEDLEQQTIGRAFAELP